MSTLTFEIKVPTTVDIITIELPYYCADDYGCWAIIEENKIISVNNWQRIGQASIWLKTEITPDIKNPNIKPITREEFLEIYNAVQSKFSELI
jgi:hypothetical protein